VASINQSKRIYIAPYVAGESEARVIRMFVVCVGMLMQLLIAYILCCGMQKFLFKRVFVVLLCFLCVMWAILSCLLLPANGYIDCHFSNFKV